MFPEQLEPDDAAVLLAWPVKAHTQVLAIIKRRRIFNIESCNPGRNILLVGLRECFPETRSISQPLFFTVLPDQCFSQFIRPGTHGFDNFLLQSRHVRLDLFTLPGTDNHLQ